MGHAPTISQVSCKSCNQPFISVETQEKILSIAREKSLASLEASFEYCPACRSHFFATLLIGDRLEKVEKPKYAAKRKRDQVRPIRRDTRLGTTVYKSQCYICNQGCDAAVHVKNSEVVLVEGDRSSAVTKGTLCSKGLASRDILYHPDRMLHPMKRTGARGEGHWQRITWDEALDEIAYRLSSIEAAFGGESIVLATGTNRGWVRYFMRFANAYGKQWIGPGIAQCFYPRMIGQMLVLGTNAMENPHYDGTRCMIIWGCNPTNTWPAKAVHMMEARSLGAFMIVIDPVFSEAASKADLWVPLRPGTDAALALGMLNVIIMEGLYDRAFVDRYCYGFEELTQRVMEYPPERVEQITWVPANTIRELARRYATTRPASITQCLSIDQNADTISTARSIAMLAAVTGNIDVAGGNAITMLHRLGARSNDGSGAWLTKRHHETRLGNRQYPLLASEACMMTPSAHNHAVWKTILTEKPYPVKAIYCHGSNMLISYANTKEVTDALMRLDFLVVADLFMTETARIADIVLPAASWMERDYVTQNEQTSTNHFHLQQKVAQRGECRTDVTILNQLAARLGFAERMFPTDEAYFDFVLEPTGLTFDQFKKIGVLSTPAAFKKYETDRFKTPSGKVQLYDERLKALGFDPLPAYREPDEGPVSMPQRAREYPLILTTGARVPVFRHSELRNIPMLREIAPELLVSINPKTAAALSIDDKDMIVVETMRGSVEAKAYLTEGIDPRVVQVPSHWPDQQNVNHVTDNEHCAPMIGSAQLRCQLCRVRKK